MGRTPLHLATSGMFIVKPNPAVITVLVEAGADLNARDKSGYTPLHTAAYKGISQTVDPAVVTALIKAGADLNARNKIGADAPGYGGYTTDRGDFEESRG